MSDTTELQHLRQRLALQARLDDLVESVGRRRLPLVEALGECLPLLRGALGAQKVWIDTLGEDLEPNTFGDPGLVDPALIQEAAALLARGDHAHARTAAGWLHVRRLDVAGETFGTVAALAPADAAAPPEERDALLHVAAEVLDNYLAAIRHAREKQRLLRRIHDALRHPVVSAGVREAVGYIDETVSFDLLIVIYHLEEDYQDSLHYMVFRGRELEFASSERVARELDALLARHGGAHPGGEVLIRDAELEHRRIVGEDLSPLTEEAESEELLRRLGYEECLETLLISGLREQSPVGKLVVGSRRPLSTYERDIFDLFADVLQKRVVDYSRAGRDLHRTFPLPTVVRLLDEPDPMRVLAPRAAELSILYADISSFTKLSEQILREPAKVSALIEAFSREAVRLLWKHGGVFDKLVGDCVIGLFGPPFHEMDAPTRALACARAARDISRWTREELPKHPVTAEIVAAGEPLGVAIGINDCPASVGIFGPNRDFTAFSPGMNNTARLQSLAVRDEVLVLEPMRALIEQAAPGVRFGELRAGKVKNVSAPLRFFTLDQDSLS
ncbi:MAG: adenylate/guanylate cyclase domain-containing protein [Planctomycetota bacterium]